MVEIDCSEKLKKYLQKIEMETGRKIELREMPASELYKMKSAFVHHHTNILILLASGSDVADPEIEQSIAHEATHGLLVYKMKYCIGFFKGKLNDKEKKLVTLVFTMVSDIVVNKLIQKEGFLPYSPKYPTFVNEEIKAMQNGIELYDEHSDDPEYRNKIMVFRYILAWGYLKYIELDDKIHEILRNFVNEFQMKNTKQFELSMQVQGIILVKDIFSATGYRRAVEKLLKLWALNNLVELRTV